MTSEVTAYSPSLDFDPADFDPAEYNNTYYQEVMEDEACLIGWQATSLDEALRAHLHERGAERFERHLDAGSGPAVHHLFALEKYSAQIDLVDFLPANLAQIAKWVRGDHDAHDWRPFVTEVLSSEGITPTDSAIEQRELAVRSKIAALRPLDLKHPTASMLAYRAPLVTSFFVADSATGETETFQEMTRNAFSMVESDGVFVAAYLGGCQQYRVGEHWVISADVSIDDIENAFGGTSATEVVIERFDTPTLEHEGFDHIFTVIAKA